MIHHLTRLFPLWALLACGLAWFFPQWFRGYQPGIMPLLALIMFCMGLGLRLDDFRRVFNSPRLIALGLLLQYSIMPAAAFFIARLLELDPLLTAGMILLGASPGGTASNVVCYLARGNVALSISLTSLSTLLAVFLTPLLSWAYMDASIHVPALEMLRSILLLVILPVAGGLLINHTLHKLIKPLSALFPLIAVVAIVMIIAIVMSLNHGRLAELSLLLMLAVILHNGVGLGSGYLAGRLFGYSHRDCKTLAIETGMQNSGLAAALALKYFAPSAALPGALFSIWHNLSGSLLASYWRRH